MQQIKIGSIIIAVLLIAACNLTKKSATSAAPAPASPTAAAPSPGFSPFIKPADGIYAPGDEELAAIRTKYKEATLDQLKEGHAIYTKGACVGCHPPANIYQIEETKWESLVDDMSLRANISDAQKDAVYKYVLAIKAKQAK